MTKNKLFFPTYFPTYFPTPHSECSAMPMSHSDSIIRPGALYCSDLRRVEESVSRFVPLPKGIDHKIMACVGTIEPVLSVLVLDLI